MQMKEQENNNTEVEKAEVKLRSIKGFPEWIQMDEKGFYHVETRHGVYILEEVSANLSMSAEGLAMRPGHKEMDTKLYQLGLISNMTVEPKLGEEQLKEMKGSAWNRVRQAATMIMGLDDFLQE